MTSSPHFHCNEESKVTPACYSPTGQTDPRVKNCSEHQTAVPRRPRTFGREFCTEHIVLLLGLLFVAPPPPCCHLLWGYR